MLRIASVLFSLFNPGAMGMRQVTAVACFVGVMFVSGAAQAGIIFTDGFEGGKLFLDPTGYGTRVAEIQANTPRTGANAVYLNNKEGVFYTLSDVYQPGTYTVSYYFKKESGFIATYSILTYGQTGFLSGQPNVGGAYFEQGALPFAYQLVTYTATVAAGSAAIGQNVQLLIDQSRLDLNPDVYRARLDDVQIEFTPATAAVPEPASVALTGLVSLVLAWRVRRKGRVAKTHGLRE